MQRFTSRLWLHATGLILGVLAAHVMEAAAGTVVLTPAKDNTLIESESGFLANGTGASMFSGRTRRFGVRRAVLAFAVAESLPAQARIDSVQLDLTMVQSMSGASTVGLHRLLHDWGEGTSSTDGGGGAAASAGDATWLHTFAPDAFWDQPGGDFAPTPSATLLVDEAGLYTWGSTKSLVADVQGWVTDPSSNFGWVLIGDENQVSAKQYATRESESSSRPRLIVHYTHPTAVESTTWSQVKKRYR